MGHLNGILARVEGNLNDNFQKSQMAGGLPGGGGGMLKLRFDQYISERKYRKRCGTLKSDYYATRSIQISISVSGTDRYTL